MSDIKQPQDRKSKAKKEPARFTFQANGKTYEFAKDTDDVITPGWLRKNRHLSPEDQFFTLVELLTDEDTLDELDGLSQKDFRRLQTEFYEHLGADRGE